LPCAKAGTRQTPSVCRVQRSRHTANSLVFAVCHTRGTRQTAWCLPCAGHVAHGKPPFSRCTPSVTLFCRGPHMAHGKNTWHTANRFAVCPCSGSRQTVVCRRTVCRVPFCTRQSLLHTANSFAVCLSGFAVCPWHTANRVFPVVRVAN